MEFIWHLLTSHVNAISRSVDIKLGKRPIKIDTFSFSILFCVPYFK